MDLSRKCIWSLTCFLLLVVLSPLSGAEIPGTKPTTHYSNEKYNVFFYIDLHGKMQAKGKKLLKIGSWLNNECYKAAYESFCQSNPTLVDTIASNWQSGIPNAQLKFNNLVFFFKNENSKLDLTCRIPPQQISDLNLPDVQAGGVSSQTFIGKLPNTLYLPRNNSTIQLRGNSIHLVLTVDEEASLPKLIRGKDGKVDVFYFVRIPSSYIEANGILDYDRPQYSTAWANKITRDETLEKCIRELVIPTDAQMQGMDSMTLESEDGKLTLTFNHSLILTEGWNKFVCIQNNEKEQEILINEEKNRNSLEIKPKEGRNEFTFAVISAKGDRLAKTFYVNKIGKDKYDSIQKDIQTAKRPEINVSCLELEHAVATIKPGSIVSDEEMKDLETKHAAVQTLLLAKFGSILEEISKRDWFMNYNENTAAIKEKIAHKTYEKLKELHAVGKYDFGDDYLTVYYFGGGSDNPISVMQEIVKLLRTIVKPDNTMSKNLNDLAGSIMAAIRAGKISDDQINNTIKTILTSLKEYAEQLYKQAEKAEQDGKFISLKSEQQMLNILDSIDKELKTPSASLTPANKLTMITQWLEIIKNWPTTIDEAGFVKEAKELHGKWLKDAKAFTPSEKAKDNSSINSAKDAREFLRSFLTEFATTRVIKSELKIGEKIKDAKRLTVFDGLFNTINNETVKETEDPFVKLAKDKLEVWSKTYENVEANNAIQKVKTAAEARKVLYGYLVSYLKQRQDDANKNGKEINNDDAEKCFIVNDKTISPMTDATIDEYDQVFKKITDLKEVEKPTKPPVGPGEKGNKQGTNDPPVSTEPQSSSDLPLIILLLVVGGIAYCIYRWWIKKPRGTVRVTAADNTTGEFDLPYGGNCNLRDICGKNVNIQLVKAANSEQQDQFVLTTPQNDIFLDDRNGRRIPVPANGFTCTTSCTLRLYYGPQAPKPFATLDFEFYE